MNAKGVFFSIIIVTFFSGCSTTIKNVSSFEKEPLKPTKFMPSADIVSGKTLPKVIILDLDDKTTKVGKGANLGSSIAGEIESQLAKGKSVSILKRVQETSMNEEMKLVELSEAVGGEDLKSADYIISGKITNATFRGVFQEKRIGKNLMGMTIIAPAKFHYYSEVRGLIQVYEVPSLDVVATFDFYDNKHREEELASSFLGLGRTQIDKQTRDDSMVRDAGSDAIHALRLEIKNFFSKKGYVYEKRSKGGVVIVKVTLGSSNGAVEEAKVKFFTVEEQMNPLTKKVLRETVEIGEGEISNQITPESSWVIVDEIYETKELKMGDFIQIEYEKEVDDYINEAGKKVNSSGILLYKDTAIDLLIEGIHRSR